MGPCVRRDDRLRNIAPKKWPGKFPGHFHFAMPYRRGGAVPGWGGGNDAVPPVSRGVVLRTVTRRLIRLGPSVYSFWDCSPYPCLATVSAGPLQRRPLKHAGG